MKPLELLYMTHQCSIAVMDCISQPDTTKPCPCEGWTVAILLDKMVTSARFFAALAAGRPPGPDIDMLFPKSIAGDDPAETYRQACAECLESFTACDLAGEIMIPPPVGKVQKAYVARLRSFDCTLNTWDLAMALGVAPGIDEPQAAAVLAFAEDYLPKIRAIKDHRRFAEPLQPPARATTLQRLVALSGRDVDWRH
jgi:uncharacterized protein (TIGR03086 family)